MGWWLVRRIIVLGIGTREVIFSLGGGGLVGSDGPERGGVEWVGYRWEKVLNVSMHVL